MSIIGDKIRERAGALTAEATAADRKEADQQARAERLNKETEKNRKKFLADTAALVEQLRRCEGESLNVACPHHNGVWANVGFVGPDDREAIQLGAGGQESGGAYIVRLRKLKDGTLRCPVCGAQFQGII